MGDFMMAQYGYCPMEQEGLRELMERVKEVQGRKMTLTEWYNAVEKYGYIIIPAPPEQQEQEGEQEEVVIFGRTFTPEALEQELTTILNRVGGADSVFLCEYTNHLNDKWRTKLFASARQQNKLAGAIIGLMEIHGVPDVEEELLLAIAEQNSLEARCDRYAGALRGIEKRLKHLSENRTHYPLIGDWNAVIEDILTVEFAALTDQPDVCERCGQPYKPDAQDCRAEACIDATPHKACFGWSGMCCYGGAEFAKGQ